MEEVLPGTGTARAKHVAFVAGVNAGIFLNLSDEKTTPQIQFWLTLMEHNEKLKYILSFQNDMLTHVHGGGFACSTNDCSYVLKCYYDQLDENEKSRQRRLRAQQEGSSSDNV